VTGVGTARDDNTLLYILGGIAVMFFVCNIPAAINLLFINEVKKPGRNFFSFLNFFLDFFNFFSVF
jgi:hypothetical protein